LPAPSVPPSAAPSLTQCLKRNRSRQSESNRAPSHLDPDCERVSADLLGGEALGTGDLARNSHGNHGTTRVADRGQGDGSDGIVAGCEAELWRTRVASHAVGE
jgi:hypothetical protein